MPKKLKCPRCSKSDYSIQNHGGYQPTFLHCKHCNYSGSEDAWLKQQQDLSASSNPFYVKRAQSTSVGDDIRPASDAPDENNKPEKQNQRGFSKKPRKNPERAFTKEDPEEIRRAFMKNPFYKKSEKIISLWKHPDRKNMMFKEVAGPDGMQFSEDDGVSWSFTMRTPEEVEKMGFFKVKQENGHQKDDKEREEMGFDDELEWEDFKDELANSNPFYKLSKKDNMKGDDGPESSVTKKEEKEMKGMKGDKGDEGPKMKEPNTKANVNPFYKGSKKDSCWEGYEQIGMKEKNGKEVPNCVPKKKKSSAMQNRFAGSSVEIDSDDLNLMLEFIQNVLENNTHMGKDNNKYNNRIVKLWEKYSNEKFYEDEEKSFEEPDFTNTLASKNKQISTNPFYRKANEFKRIPSKEQEALILLDELIQAIDDTRDFNSLDMRGTVLSRLRSIRELVKKDEIEENIESWPFRKSNEMPSNFDEIFSNFKQKGLDEKTAIKKALQKIAREFSDRSEHGKKMKELSDDNMVYPEDPIHERKHKSSKDNDQKKKPGGESGYLDELNPSFDFNTVDRKEYRSSPKAQDFDPGYRDWYDREVDQYYDGWLDDHIKNSGGSIPGSNTEKTMNLNDGERAHAPEYPTEAIYEKLLESRHNFDDDYQRIVANGKTYKIKTSEVQNILIEAWHNKKISTEQFRKAMNLDEDNKSTKVSNSKKKIQKKSLKSPLHIVLT